MYEPASVRGGKQGQRQCREFQADRHHKRLSGFVPDAFFCKHVRYLAIRYIAGGARLTRRANSRAICAAMTVVKNSMQRVAKKGALALHRSRSL
jgi:hypothetical protein